MIAEHRSSAPSRRLLTLTPDYFPSLGGIQILLLRLHEYLPGWQHEVVARHSAGAQAGPAVVRRTRRPTGHASIVELNLLAVRTALRAPPDVILNAHIVTTPAALLLSQVLRRPVVSYLYADELPGHPRLVRSACAGSASSIAVSRYARDLALGSASPRAPIHVVLPGIDQVPENALPPSLEREPLLVTVSRLADRYKGHDVVLRALPAVLAAVPGARWVIAGDGPLRSELERLAGELGLAERVTFVGRLTDAERDRLLDRAAVFVMPSRLPFRGAGGEGFGIVYLEAALRGVPSVAGDIGGSVDAVVDGETGLLVDATSPEAVAAALIGLLDDEPRRRQMGLAAWRRARRFTWRRMADEVDTVLQTALASGRARWQLSP
jgi:phosphatidylinositol alpha-1,6-mannosyltransferase